MGFNRLDKILESTGQFDAKGRPIYRVHDGSLIYERNCAGGGVTVVVPEGYPTNLASTPRIFWSIFPPFGRYERAAIVHDYLCEMGGKEPDPYRRQELWFLADSVFYIAMSELHVPLWKRMLMYRAVRIHHVIGRKP